MRPRLLLGLILCNAIWAGNPVAGKILLEHFQPLQVAWLRSTSTLATIALLALCMRLINPRQLTPLRTVAQPRILKWLVALGLITFFGSALIQFLGLARSTATSYVVIVATEPLIALFLAWAFLRERIRRVQLFAFFVAIFGFCLLSNLRPDDFLASIAIFNTGNLFILASMFSDSMYSVISRKLSDAVKPISLIASALPFGCLALTAFLWLQGAPFPISLSRSECLALLLLGPIGTALTYCYWSFALAEATVANVSLTLFTQPILGTLAGMLFLGDHLSPWQAVGAALIVAALCLQTKVALKGEA